jgi:hypothetical protein
MRPREGCGVTDAELETEASSRRFPTGTRVEVRSRFDGEWTSGFEVAEVTDEGYRIRRLSDGTVLPSAFTGDDVRRERRRETWWI